MPPQGHSPVRDALATPASSRPRTSSSPNAPDRGSLEWSWFKSGLPENSHDVAKGLRVSYLSFLPLVQGTCCRWPRALSPRQGDAQGHQPPRLGLRTGGSGRPPRGPWAAQVCLKHRLRGRSPASAGRLCPRGCPRGGRVPRHQGTGHADGTPVSRRQTVLPGARTDTAGPRGREGVQSCIETPPTTRKK